MTHPDREARSHIDPRQWQERRSFTDRLFPGPSAPLSRDEAERMQQLLTARRRDHHPTATPGQPVSPEASTPAPTAEASTADTPAPAAASDDANLREALDEQNDLLRAILSSTLDTQTDARATAQNSRTFAGAGTAIAFLTLIASVALVIEAVSGH
jgi:hypothetical protein